MRLPLLVPQTAIKRGKMHDLATRLESLDRGKVYTIAARILDRLLSQVRRCLVPAPSRTRRGETGLRGVRALEPGLAGLPPGRGTTSPSACFVNNVRVFQAAI